jgi:hypothetical protein
MTGMAARVVYTGVVHEHVEPTENIDGECDRGLRGVLVSYVEANLSNSITISPDHHIELAVLAGTGDDPVSRRKRGLSDVAAEPVPTAGN